MSQSDGNRSAQDRSESPADDWTNVTDPSKRRQIQNKLAQRKFREKQKQQKEDAERDAENERQARGSYKAPEAGDIDETAGEEGLPWGSISLGHIINTGQGKEDGSRETSLYAAASKAGGSSRLGLHLIDNYARGSPAWAAWRARFAAFDHANQAAETQRSGSQNPG